jgi:hypothetical protein
MSYGIFIVVTAPDRVTAAARSGTQAEVAAFAREVASRYGAAVEVSRGTTDSVVAAKDSVIRVFTVDRSARTGDADIAEKAFRDSAYAWSVDESRTAEDQLPADIKDRLPTTKEATRG